MSDFLSLIVNVTVIILVIAFALSTYRIWTGPSAMERLQAVDLSTTILLAIIIVLGILLQNSQIVDIGIALAAFSFVSTLAISRFISEGRFF